MMSTVAFIFVCVLCGMIYQFQAFKLQGGCSYKGSLYKNGDSIAIDDCQKSCICKENGKVVCQSACPMVDISCPPQHKVQMLPALKTNNGRCACPVPICIPTGFCHVEGKKYKQGERFIKKDCSASCTCGENGIIRCVSLCPPKRIRCPPGLTAKFMLEQVKGSGNCFCPEPKCVAGPDRCHADGRVFKKGEQFVPKDCSGWCTCATGGRILCVSLCPPRHLRCSPGEKQIYVKRPLVGLKRCSCPTPECVSNAQ